MQVANRSADRSGDPNFPQGLRIQPSSLQRTIPTASHDVNGSNTAQPKEATWEQDTAQDIDDYGIAGRIWEAAYLLARYVRPAKQSQGELVFDPPCSLFDRHSSEPLMIVELGSGAGYGSLHLAQQLTQHAVSRSSATQPARLVLTDLANVVPLMERNVARAGYDKANDIIDVRVRSLAWGSEEDATSLLSELSCSRATSNPLTHILCSDLVYFPQLLPPLLRSIISLSSYALAEGSSTSSSALGPELIISYKIRSLTKEQPFWSALGSWFDFQTVDCRSTAQAQNGTDDEDNTWHRFGSQGEDYGASSDSDQELFIFVGRRRDDSIGCVPPQSDTELMQGKRLRPCKTQGDGAEATARFELETPASGQDYFEWLLLSNMGAGLG